MDEDVERCEAVASVSDLRMIHWEQCGVVAFAAFVGNPVICSRIIARARQHTVFKPEACVKAALMRASLCEPGSEAERLAVECGRMIMRAFYYFGDTRSLEELTVRQDMPDFQVAAFLDSSEVLWKKGAFPKIPGAKHCMRFAECVYGMAVGNNVANIKIPAIHNAFVTRYFFLSHHLPLTHPEAVVVISRLMAKYDSFRAACDHFRENVMEIELCGRWHFCCTALFCLSMGWVELTLSMFEKIVIHHDPCGEQSVLHISQKLVDMPRPKEMFEAQKGDEDIRQCRSILSRVLAFDDSQVALKILGNLLRCSSFCKYDMRYEAMVILNRMRKEQPTTTTKQHSVAQQEFVIAYLRHRIRNGDFLGKPVTFAPLHEIHTPLTNIIDCNRCLFYASSSQTAQTVWSLFVEMGVRINTTDGLRIYSPLMSPASLRCFVMSHPLAAYRTDLVLEHHSFSTKHMAKHDPNFVYAHVTINDYTNLASVVRCLGGVRLPKLWHWPLPQRAVRAIVGWLI